MLEKIQHKPDLVKTYIKRIYKFIAYISFKINLMLPWPLKALGSIF